MRFLFALALILFSSNWAQAQSGAFAQTPINLKTIKLPAYFRGHDPGQVYIAFNSDSINKGKYETSSQWANRQVLDAKKTRFGRVSKLSPLGFVNMASFCDYNADTNEFVAHFVTYKGLVDQDFGDGIHLSSEFLRSNSFSHENYSRIENYRTGWGTKRKVLEAATSFTGFSVTNWKDFPFVSMSDENIKYRLSYKSSLPPYGAQKLEKNVAALFVGYSDFPHRGKWFEEERPSYDSPYNLKTSYYFTCLRLKEVWFFNYETGIILGKVFPISSNRISK